MFSVTKILTEKFATAIKSAYSVDLDPAIAVAQKIEFGDYQANFAFALAKKVAEMEGRKVAPREVAEKVLAVLDVSDIVESVQVAGAGFINIKLKNSTFYSALSNALKIEKNSDETPVVIDYSSPNIAKEMHVGHLRSTNIGDAISRILEFSGCKVIRQNHFGDWGTQFGMLLLLMQEEKEAHPQLLNDLENFYRSAKKRFDEDPDFADRARAMVVKLQSGDETALKLWKDIVAASRTHFEDVYARMSISLSQADERGESFYNDMLESVVKELTEKGIAEEDAGALIVRVDGFDAPLIVRKSGGGFGYDTTDLAALRFRTQELKARRIIYVTDARQSQHFQQVFNVAKRAGWVEGVELDHVAFGMVLGNDGTPFKTRSGGTVKLVELLNEAEKRAGEIIQSKMQERGVTQDPETVHELAQAIGIGALKYQDLNHAPSSNYVFDYDKMLAFEGNTAPYLQYAFARICSIFDKNGLSAPESVELKLESVQERELARHIALFADTLEVVSRDLKPHILCTYLYDLAVKFSSFYEHCPIMKAEDEATKQSRLFISAVSAKLLSQGLDLLGIKHPRQL